MFRRLVTFTIVVAIVVVGSKFLRPKFSVIDGGVVVITGASSGIGRAAALHLSHHGFKVFAGVRRSIDGDSIVSASNGTIM